MDIICTWGEGPDIMINLNGKILVLYEEPDMKGFKHGTIRQGSMDFNLDEAKELLIKLQKVIDQTERMKRELKEYEENRVINTPLKYKEWEKGEEDKIIEIPYDNRFDVDDSVLIVGKRYTIIEKKDDKFICRKQTVKEVEERGRI